MPSKPPVIVTAYIKGKNNVQTLLDYVTVLITAIENSGSKSRGLYPRK